MKEVIRQATDVVLHRETEIVQMLFRELDESKKRAEKCKCPACQKHVQGIEELLAKELERIAPLVD